MRKKIGIFTPVKSPDAPNMVVSELLYEPVVNELYNLLDNDSSLTYQKDIDVRKSYIKNGKVYFEDICVSDLDLFFWYYLPAYEADSFELSILKTLARHTKVIPNPTGLVTTMDKFSAHSALKAMNLPVVDFALFSSADMVYAKKLLKEWGSMLLKPTLGRFGHGIIKVDNEQLLRDAVGYAASFHPNAIPIFAEKFEENDIHKWISATVIGDEVMFGYRKKESKFAEGWKVYDEGFQGGEAYYVDPAPVADIAVQAKRALGADIVGFDCIYVAARDEYRIVDENTFPGMYEECFTQSKKGSQAQNFYRLITDGLASV